METQIAGFRSLADHIRKRPGMYIGGASERGLYFMTVSLVDEQLLQSRGRVSEARIIVRRDGFLEIELIGEVGDIRADHFNALDEEKNLREQYELTVLSAMSQPLEFEMIRDGRRWRQTFAAGAPVGPASVDGVDLPSVLRLKFRPDPSIFKDAQIPFLWLCGRLSEIAMFQRDCTFHIEDQRPGGQMRQYRFRQGLRNYVEEREHHKLYLHHFELADGPDRVEAVLFTNCFDAYLSYSFANGKRMMEGTHLEAFEASFAKMACRFRHLPGYPFASEEEGDNPLEALTVYLSLSLTEPQYGGPTPSRLEGQRPAELVTRMMDEQLLPMLAMMCKS